MKDANKKKRKELKIALKHRREKMKEQGFFDGRYQTKLVSLKKYKKPKYKKDDYEY